MNISFEGKRALVTGAAGSIGKAITELLVKCGATVIAVDVRGDALQALYKDCPQVVPAICDLTQWEATKEIVTNHLPIDLLVNNAGLNIERNFLEYDLEAIDKIIALNFKAAINTSQVVIKDLLERKSGGSIANMSSVVSRGAGPLTSIYATSKAALSSLTENMAAEFGQHGIRVNSVRPGGVITPALQPLLKMVPTFEQAMISKTPTGRLSTSQDIAQTVCFLLSDQASNITGTSVTVDGGITAHAL